MIIIIGKIFKIYMIANHLVKKPKNGGKPPIDRNKENSKILLNIVIFIEFELIINRELFVFNI